MFCNLCSFSPPPSFRHRCSKTERDAQHFILNVKVNSLCIQYEVLHFSFNEDRGCAAAACRGEAAEVEERWMQGGWGSSFLCTEAAAGGFPGLFLPLSSSVSLFSASALQFCFFFPFRGFPCYSCTSSQPGPSSTPSPNPYEVMQLPPTSIPPAVWRARGTKQMQRGMKKRI